MNEELWIDTRGNGSDVLLIAGLSDPAEAWTEQLEGLSGSWRVTAYDNRGSGRTPLPDGPMTTATMADDAAAVIRAVGADSVHVCGFSGGSAIAQELALRYPDAVRSLVLMSTYAEPDAYFRATFESWRRLARNASDERAMLEDFFLWIYTARAHASGLVAQLIDETLAFPHPQSTEAFLAQIDALVNHSAYDRLPQIDVPTLVLAGGDDITTPPRLGRIVADRIPGARFEVMPGEAHQPFQESPVAFNERVERFWRAVEAQSGRRAA
jgi:pimeloyl-ACP methyl ester carboxylesterase